MVQEVSSEAEFRRLTGQKGKLVVVSGHLVQASGYLPCVLLGNVFSRRNLRGTAVVSLLVVKLR